MVTLSDITSIHWQPALNSEDIHQAIQVILGTPKGSRPHSPDFGTDIQQYLDFPISEAIPHVVREATDAIAKWESRCTLVKVVPQVDESHLSLRVRWKLADGVERQTNVGMG